uniref:Uncharacterized protein n=1 Tax=Caenorhabditis elegans TaxID=6239 RepID=A0A2K5AU15_CAEEL|eukprot:NP_001348816.2 Uncharacterized protein CELE_T04C10.11 [Caenorhabditis elegans]
MDTYSHFLAETSHLKIMNFNMNYSTEPSQYQSYVIANAPSATAPICTVSSFNF